MQKIAFQTFDQNYEQYVRIQKFISRNVQKSHSKIIILIMFVNIFDKLLRNPNQFLSKKIFEKIILCIRKTYFVTHFSNFRFNREKKFYLHNLDLLNFGSFLQKFSSSCIFCVDLLRSWKSQVEENPMG